MKQNIKEKDIEDSGDNQESEDDCRESIEGAFGNLKQFKRIKKKYDDLKQAIKLYRRMEVRD